MFNEHYWDEWAYYGGFDGHYTMYWVGMCGDYYYDYYDYFYDYFYYFY